MKNTLLLVPVDATTYTFVASLTGTNIDSPAANGNPSVSSAESAVTLCNPTYIVAELPALAVICTPLSALVVLVVNWSAVVPMLLFLPVRKLGTAVIVYSL
jgi:hypothetical protein|tara:strand:- start:917 stop:1219 length:303 start_codon:yes stop_codon:yes gene_type:complete